ncbi:MAG TPA: pyridoxal-phosphate dependent enzyme [Bacteroidales bacterium]|nr:pyridoxal-phosphate dependent enzyme [Bacteroidales bacterium]
MKIPDKTIIEEAAWRIKQAVNHTPVMTSQSLNEMYQTHLYLKCENFQKAGVFKSRGACNAVFSLDQDQLNKGVATHSSGNHAQALARAAKLRNARAYVVMPENSSKVKIEAVKAYGGLITFCKPTLEARESTLKEVISRTGALEIHPYDNYQVIAGQATAAKELIQEIPGLDYIICPVGGGGLLSGALLAAKYFSPFTKVIAAEPEQANDAYLSFKSKTFIPSIHPDTIADGLRTSLGELTFPIIMEHLHDIFTVSESDIIASMKLIWERMKIIVEPSSAVTLAVIKNNPGLFIGKRTGIIVSGGNVDLNDLLC